MFHNVLFSKKYKKNFKSPSAIRLDEQFHKYFYEDFVEKQKKAKEDKES